MKLPWFQGQGRVGHFMCRSGREVLESDALLAAFLISVCCFCRLYARETETVRHFDQINYTSACAAIAAHVRSKVSFGIVGLLTGLVCARCQAVPFAGSQNVAETERGTSRALAGSPRRACSTRTTPRSSRSVRRQRRSARGHGAVFLKQLSSSGGFRCSDTWHIGHE